LPGLTRQPMMTLPDLALSVPLALTASENDRPTGRLASALSTIRPQKAA
jgi:hypothetical protein